MAHNGRNRRFKVVIEQLSVKADNKPGLYERHFWIFACCVILIWIITRVFDFSLMPQSPASAGASSPLRMWRGLFITRPYYGLHSWHFTSQIWAARSHVKYGLGYTKGYRTLVVGNPPPEHPQHYVGHPPLETLIMAFGMLLFGTEDWETRLFDLILSVPVLLLILYFLRKLYGSGCALLSGLLLVELLYDIDAMLMLSVTMMASHHSLFLYIMMMS